MIRKMAEVACQRMGFPTRVTMNTCNDCRYAKMINQFGIVECTYDECDEDGKT